MDKEPKIKNSGLNLDAGWVNFFSEEVKKEYFPKLGANVQIIRNRNIPVLPPGGKVLEAFKKTPFSNLKAVIVGQDPYHVPGMADGLAFSVPEDMPIPPSLKNIFKELNRSLGVDIPSHGNLSSWAEGGILLLNSVLTVEAGTANSHKDLGWKIFTDNCIKYINDNKTGIIFCLWGKQAQEKAKYIDYTKHAILCTSHPSPLSVKQGFDGCDHFKHLNKVTGLWN